MAAHFLPRKRKWGRERRTWAMVRGGKAVRSRTDYILGTDRCLFTNVVARDPRYNSDHYMVMGLLRGGTAKAHDKYIVGRRKVPMQPRGEADAGGETLRGSAAGRAETATAGTASERVDLRGDMATHR